jgi:hypothetical protein
LDSGEYIISTQKFIAQYESMLKGFQEQLQRQSEDWRAEASEVLRSAIGGYMGGSSGGSEYRIAGRDHDLLNDVSRQVVELRTAVHEETRSNAEMQKQMQKCMREVQECTKDIMYMKSGFETMLSSQMTNISSNVQKTVQELETKIEIGSENIFNHIENGISVNIQRTLQGLDAKIEKIHLKSCEHLFEGREHNITSHFQKITQSLEAKIAHLNVGRLDVVQEQPSMVMLANFEKNAIGNIQRTCKGLEAKIEQDIQSAMSQTANLVSSQQQEVRRYLQELQDLQRVSTRPIHVPEFSSGMHGQQVLVDSINTVSGGIQRVLDRINSVSGEIVSQQASTQQEMRKCIQEVHTVLAAESRYKPVSPSWSSQGFETHISQSVYAAVSQSLKDDHSHTDGASRHLIRECASEIKNTINARVQECTIEIKNAMREQGRETITDATVHRIFDQYESKMHRTNITDATVHRIFEEFEAKMHRSIQQGFDVHFVNQIASSAGALQLQEMKACMKEFEANSHLVKELGHLLAKSSRPVSPSWGITGYDTNDDSSPLPFAATTASSKNVQDSCWMLAVGSVLSVSSSVRDLTNEIRAVHEEASKMQVLLERLEHSRHPWGSATEADRVIGSISSLHSFLSEEVACLLRELKEIRRLPASPRAVDPWVNAELSELTANVTRNLQRLEGSLGLTLPKATREVNVLRELGRKPYDDGSSDELVTVSFLNRITHYGAVMDSVVALLSELKQFKTKIEPYVDEPEPLVRWACDEVVSNLASEHGVIERAIARGVYKVEDRMLDRANAAICWMWVSIGTTVLCCVILLLATLSS